MKMYRKRSSIIHWW